jgi:glycosyltransferase involved in cell wall biosynthesis
LRIALVETSAHGGLLHYVVQLGDALARRGNDVDLITARGNELADRQLAANMRDVLTPPIVRPVPTRTRLGYYFRRANVGMRLALTWTRAVREVRSRGRYDAVILNADLSLPPAALGGGLILSGKRSAVIANVCHNVRLYNRWGGDLTIDSAAAEAPMRRLYPRFDVVFVHGERSLREFEEHWPPASLAVIPHGDERIFGDDPPPPADEERILFFGDLRKVKGLDVLMEAFDLLAARRESTRLTIAGTPSPADWDPGPMRDWAAGYDGRVEVIDRYVEIEEVPALFGRARVVVTPYLIGYQSGVIHLAMTMARAVVSSDVGDLGTAVRHGETGRLVPPGDPAALADALEAVASDPDLAERLGSEGRARLLEDSSWERVAERVEEALSEAAARRGSAPPARTRTEPAAAPPSGRR